MRTGHLRNLNHEVRKKNAKNPHIIFCCSLRVCSLHDLWLCGDWMAVCVSHQENWRGQLCLYLELVVSSIRPPYMYFGTIRFWSCLSKQINSHDIQNINTLMSEQNGIDFGIDIMCSFVYKFSILGLTSA